MAGAQLAQARQLIGKANTGLTYMDKFKSLRDLFKQLDQLAPTPQNKTMITGMNGLFWAISLRPTATWARRV